MGLHVKTLTNHPDLSSPLYGRLEVAPYNFDRPNDLAKSLKDVQTLYVTYWVRFPHKGVTFEKAVGNAITLFNAAREAGVHRIVYVSITNPSIDLPLPYFSGKARLEEALKALGTSYAIIRPTVVFGTEDILVNNIAWLLRKFPLFFVPGDGQYRIQPVYVEDLAQMVVEAGGQNASFTKDAVGPEAFSYDQLVRLIAEKVNSKARIVHAPPSLVLAAAKALGFTLRDVLLTRDEIDGLMRGLLVSNEPPACSTIFSQWLEGNKSRLGTRYASEVARRR